MLAPAAGECERYPGAEPRGYPKTTTLMQIARVIGNVVTSVKDHGLADRTLLMIQPITRLNFDDFTELTPAFLTVALMIFTYNIGVGMTAGLIAYPLIKVLAGREREVPPGLWVLAVLSLSFFVFYPYR